MMQLLQIWEIARGKLRIEARIQFDGNVSRNDARVAEVAQSRMIRQLEAETVSWALWGRTAAFSSVAVFLQIHQEECRNIVDGQRKLSYSKEVAKL